MPTNNERLLSFLEVKRIIKRFNRKALASLQHAIDSDQTFIGILENV